MKHLPKKVVAVLTATLLSMTSLAACSVPNNGEVENSEKATNHSNQKQTKEAWFEGQYILPDSVAEVILELEEKPIDDHYTLVGIHISKGYSGNMYTDVVKCVFDFNNTQLIDPDNKSCEHRSVDIAGHDELLRGHIFNRSIDSYSRVTLPAVEEAYGTNDLREFGFLINYYRHVEKKVTNDCWVYDGGTGLASSETAVRQKRVEDLAKGTEELTDCQILN